MDLVALFLNFVPPAQATFAGAKDLVNEPVDGIVQRGPVQRGTRLDEAKILELIASYLAGSSVPQLARTFNLDRGTVYHHLQRADVPRRPACKLTPAQLDEMRRLRADGHTLAQLAAHFGVAVSTIHRLLTEPKP